VAFYHAAVADWATISSLATAGGTLVLAAATFVSVRSSSRGARATERALLAGIRPLLVPSRLEDPPVKIGFADDHWVRVAGGRAVLEVTDTAIYLAISVRNVGNGIAVLDRWTIYPETLRRETPDPDERSFQRLTRDIYVPPGEIGFWQGALRDPDDRVFRATREAITERRGMNIDLLYGDHEGGQRMISRFSVVPTSDEQWLATVGRHWNLDRADPR
jgi:hypothetical protein